MEQEIAKQLFKSLCEHVTIISPKEELFLPMLVATDLPESSRFYESLPNNQKIVSDEYDQDHYLSLRRILINKEDEDAPFYVPSGLHRDLCKMVLGMASYSSDNLCFDIQTNPEIVNIMRESTHSFSLLGKLETSDWGIGI